MPFATYILRYFRAITLFIISYNSHIFAQSQNIQTFEAIIYIVAIHHLIFNDFTFEFLY